MRILFAGGGTGGHLYPALAIAEEMKRIDNDCSIEFIGTKYGLEYRMKDSLGYKLHTIAMRGIPRSLSIGLLAFPFRLISSVMKCRRIFKSFNPDVVVGTGGYVAGPPIIAASIGNIPCVLQEQNSYPGMVTRKFASKTNLVFLAYKQAEKYLPEGVDRKFIGNPIRCSIISGNREKALEQFGLHNDRKTILILGGSQGAHRINEAILNSIDKLDNGIQVLWQCGKRDYTEVKARLNKRDFVVSLFPFSNDMKSVYAAADIAIARAGALTIAELTACGIPAIFIPYPHATADHQTHNAEAIVEAGAAEMITDSKLDEVDVLTRAVDILRSDNYTTMKQAAAEIGQPGAAAQIAKDIFSLVKGDRIDN
ncbi:MAG: undecaprenyldiphospho-muramoylpentapeptide beta-N-acetylglucosaminyltransferase [candidate division Zixibacteria bacterium]|nr:undecaprenyldiphospho-muramoylpentapeptide beta-N-acetylglucosaminyltransferase [candidate division Zixibacteria bacterium]